MMHGRPWPALGLALLLLGAAAGVQPLLPEPSSIARAAQAKRVTVREMIWRNEWVEQGVRLLQVTSGEGAHMNIYGEVPYMDAAGKRLIYTRRPTPRGPTELWCADLERQSAALISADSNVNGVAVSPDQKYFYFIPRSTADALRLMRLDLSSLDQKAYDIPGALPPRTLGSVTPGGRFYVCGVWLPGDPRRFGIQRLDLERASSAIVHAGSELCNSHPQVEPRRGLDCLIQHNRGCQVDEQGHVLRLTGDEGATLYLVDIDGGRFRPLPVGKPFTKPVQGHQCWIGGTGQVLLTIMGGPADEMVRAGNLLRARPGADKAEVVASGYVFCHVNASRSGRFFVCDTYRDGKIVVGSLRTGRTRLLCESRASFGTSGFSHPHPYLSPDCRWVVFNSDRTGTPHVYAARVPDGWLEALDRDHP